MRGIGLAIMVATICFLAGFAVGQDNFEPEIPKIEYVTIIEKVPEPYEVVKERVVVVTKEVPTEVIVYRNIYSRDFPNVTAFKDWYNAQGFNILFPSGTYEVDCDDYAERVQKKALEQGYSISQALTLNGKYCGVEVTDKDRRHAGNLVLIGNAYYWVEPHPKEFKVIKICDRD